MKLAACAVFAFDNQSRVSQLAIYIDRYKMKVQLTPATSVDAGEIISLLVRRLSLTDERATAR